MVLRIDGLMTGSYGHPGCPVWSRLDGLNGRNNCKYFSQKTNLVKTWIVMVCWISWRYTLKWNCCHTDEIFITGYTVICLKQEKHEFVLWKWPSTGWLYQLQIKKFNFCLVTSHWCVKPCIRRSISDGKLTSCTLEIHLWYVEPAWLSLRKLHGSVYISFKWSNLFSKFKSLLIYCWI